MSLLELNFATLPSGNFFREHLLVLGFTVTKEKCDLHFTPVDLGTQSHSQYVYRVNTECKVWPCSNRPHVYRRVPAGILHTRGPMGQDRKNVCPSETHILVRKRDSEQGR